MELLWWILNVVGLLVVIPVALFLGSRVIRAALEIRSYLFDIGEHAAAIGANLRPLSELNRTGELARAVGDATSGKS